MLLVLQVTPSLPVLDGSPLLAAIVGMTLLGGVFGTWFMLIAEGLGNHSRNDPVLSKSRRHSDLSRLRSVLVVIAVTTAGITGIATVFAWVLSANGDTAIALGAFAIAFAVTASLLKKHRLRQLVASWVARVYRGSVWYRISAGLVIVGNVQVCILYFLRPNGFVQSWYLPIVSFSIVLSVAILSCSLFGWTLIDNSGCKMEGGTNVHNKSGERAR